MNRGLALGGAGDRLLEAQLVKDTLIQLHLGLPALPQMVVVVLKTLPVRGELFQAVGVDIFDNRSSTSRHLPSLLQTIELPPSIGLLLALHVVIIEGLAPVADKVRRTGQGCRGRADFLDTGNVRRHGRGVHQDLLVELRFSGRHFVWS